MKKTATRTTKKFTKTVRKTVKPKRKIVKREKKVVEQRTPKQAVPYKPTGVVRKYNPKTGEVIDQPAIHPYGLIKRRPIDGTGKTFSERF